MNDMPNIDVERMVFTPGMPKRAVDRG